MEPADPLLVGRRWLKRPPKSLAVAPGAEVKMICDLLHEEEIVVMAEAHLDRHRIDSRHWHFGVVALTGRRLLFAEAGVFGKRFVERFDLNTLRSIDRSGLGRSKVWLSFQDREAKLSRIVPAPRLAELYEAMSARLGQGS